MCQLYILKKIFYSFYNIKPGAIEKKIINFKFIKEVKLF